MHANLDVERSFTKSLIQADTCIVDIHNQTGTIVGIYVLGRSEGNSIVDWYK